jgi:hypothetical protein
LLSFRNEGLKGLGKAGKAGKAIQKQTLIFFIFEGEVITAVVSKRMKRESTALTP